MSPMTQYFKAINRTTGQVLSDKVKIAQDFKSRSIGLLNRTSLESGEGLLIKPCNSIHMFFMKFPIDVLFLDRKGRVVKIKMSLKPWRISSALIYGYMVLELPNGALNEALVKLGDIIGFV